MATGDFWNLDNPLKPFGTMDPNDVKSIPFDFSAWLANEGTAYQSHNLSCDSGLTASFISITAGIILVQISKNPAQTLLNGRKYGVTCQLVAADGQKQSQTLYFKITEK